MNRLIKEEIDRLSYRYKGRSDEDLLSEINDNRDCGDVVFYLLYGKYIACFETIFRNLHVDANYFPDLMAELELSLLTANCKALRSFRGESSLKTWLITVAHNLFANSLAKIAKLYWVDTEMTERNIPTSISGQTDIETWLTYRQVICLLPSVEQRIVLMREIEGYNATEIADMLTQRRNEQALSTHQRVKEVNVNNVYKMRQRAIAYLRNLMKNERDRIAEMESNILFRIGDDEKYCCESTPQYGYKTFIIANIKKIEFDLEQFFL